MTGYPGVFPKKFPCISKFGAVYDRSISLPAQHRWQSVGGNGPPAWVDPTNRPGPDWARSIWKGKGEIKKISEQADSAIRCERGRGAWKTRRTGMIGEFYIPHSGEFQGTS
jgi:hypothetical protein